MDESSWMWMTDASVFVGYDDQRRKFTDFSTWESQNWFMLEGRRGLGPGTLTLDGMVSLEPFTLKKIGSHQVFQTGETFDGRPLIDYQHPHDLVMSLGGRYRIESGEAVYTVSASLVGNPALGPTPYMHRESGRDNPQAPLIHHYTDSTHSTPGVLTAGVARSGVTVEACGSEARSPTRIASR